VPKTDEWLLHSDTGPTHPHELLLEIAVETGMIGLLGYLLALGYWLRSSFFAARQGLATALPWMSAVIIAIMPINAHMAFYASFWSSITWWLVALAAVFYFHARGDQTSAS
jgi:hypothetical protein